MATVDGYLFPDDRWYDGAEHLWVLPEPDDMMLRIGVDALGQEALGEVVYVELTHPAGEVERGAALGSVEAEKMVRPVLAPVTGAVVEVNPAVVANPRLLNASPYDEGWLFRVRPSRWPAERSRLLHGERAVTAWARAELAR